MKGKNKETIEEQLRLHKRQNKDDRCNYFGREFNCLWYCWELEKYTIKEIKRLNNIINETRRILGEYENYTTPDETQNKFNNEIVYKAYRKLHSNLEVKENK